MFFWKVWNFWEKKKQKKFREEFQKYCSWKWQMTNLWKDKFGPNKALQKEPDKLDWTKSMHHRPKPILRNIFFKWLFISSAP